MSSTMEVAKKLWKRVSNHFHLLSARVAKEPRLQFRAATKHGALYDMKLLGIRQIPHSYDADKAMQAIDEFRNPSRAVRGKPAVYLHVSAQGLKLIDDDWNLLLSFPLDSLSASYDDETDPRIYAFVGVDTETKSTFCVCLRAFLLTGITGDMIQCAVDAAFAKKHHLMQVMHQLAVRQATWTELCVQEDPSSSTEPGPSGFSPDEINCQGHVDMTSKWSPSLQDSDSDGIDYIFKVRHAMLSRSWHRHQYSSDDESQQSD